MALDKELIDKLIEGYQKPEDLIGENGLLKQLTKALIERAMKAELTHQLGYEKHDPEGRGSGNSRNGMSRKKLKGDFGEVEIEVPRDREGQFEPQDRAEASTAIRRIRRQDSVDVCARHDHTRDPRASGRDLWGGNQSVANIRGHGWSH